ncbi:histidine phosphotransferase [Leptospira hartskeerlii]|uniref:Histidine phosphotransferase n=1 Tax=Leptospira hartskeerlii TaxID=2023177 RepID=A0A2M9X913_9LEPT|nr:Hpt domain-containing protein [Leptospira hartskeerlii]PJZ24177.1 histidine phosphotransferase [Leptospira hartskeerlii]PJZ35171.1 histidine phosphotransferase [Leptospira hartskeerlii]
MLVDWSRLDSLKQGDDEDDIIWLEEMVRSLRKNMNSRLENIKSFTDEKKSVELQAELHQTKGVAANFGLAAVQKNVTEAELKLKEGNLEACLALCQELPSLWEQTKKELAPKFPE